jgi:hypothetical protein
MSSSILLVVYYFYSNKIPLIKNTNTNTVDTKNTKEFINKTVIKGDSLELSCEIKSDLFTCSHPINYKNIKLSSGEILKISFSNEQDSFGKKTTDYYIIVPYIFIVDFFIALSSNEIKFNTLDDFLLKIQQIDTEYENNKMCLNLQLKTRGESKPPVNTTCIFFNFTNLGSLVKIFEKSLIKYIPVNILKDYYNKIDIKIKNGQVTIFEYVMYISSLNTINNKINTYYSICNSDNTISC